MYILAYQSTCLFTSVVISNREYFAVELNKPTYSKSWNLLFHPKDTSTDLLLRERRKKKKKVAYNI